MKIERYKRTRFWALRDGDGRLICLTVYRRGAQEVRRRLVQARREPDRRPPGWMTHVRERKM